jgi:hypothetical protein
MGKLAARSRDGCDSETADRDVLDLGHVLAPVLAVGAARGGESGGAVVSAALSERERIELMRASMGMCRRPDPCG